MTDDKEAAFNIDTIDGKIAFIESILFVSKEPVEPEKIMIFLNLQEVGDFEKIVTEMDERYRKNDRGIVLKRAGGGLQLSTKPVMHDCLKDFFSKKISAKLSIPSLETLAIIAYKQPATIAEISDLRGVNSVGPVKNLLQKKLIKMQRSE